MGFFFYLNNPTNQELLSSCPILQLRILFQSILVRVMGSCLRKALNVVSDMVLQFSERALCRRDNKQYFASVCNTVFVLFVSQCGVTHRVHTHFCMQNSRIFPQFKQNHYFSFSRLKILSQITLQELGRQTHRNHDAMQTYNNNRGDGGESF